MQLRQKTNFKKIFYRGINLKQYMKKSVCLFSDNDSNETTLIKDFEFPVDFQLQVNYNNKIEPSFTKLDTDRSQTKVSTSKSLEKDSFLPILYTQKPIHKKKLSNEKPILNSNLNKGAYQLMKRYQLPDLQKRNGNVDVESKNNIKNLIKKRLPTRQKCMASREVSRQSSMESREAFEIDSKNLSNAEYIEMVRRGIKSKIGVNSSYIQLKVNDCGEERISRRKNRSVVF